MPRELLIEGSASAPIFVTSKNRNDLSGKMVMLSMYGDCVFTLHVKLNVQQLYEGISRVFVLSNVTINKRAFIDWLSINHDNFADFAREFEAEFSAKLPEGKFVFHLPDVLIQPYVPNFIYHLRDKGPQPYNPREIFSSASLDDEIRRNEEKRSNNAHCVIG